MIATSAPKPVPIWNLYLIECLDGSYYTGVTTDVERRFTQHLNGDGARYTRSHKPLRLLASRAVGTRSAVLTAELAVKCLPKEEEVSAVAMVGGNDIGEEHMS